MKFRDPSCLCDGPDADHLPLLQVLPALPSQPVLCRPSRWPPPPILLIHNPRQDFLVVRLLLVLKQI